MANHSGSAPSAQTFGLIQNTAMPSAAAEFFASVVEPTVAEFIANPQDVRRGRLSAIVLHHMTDHFALDGYEGGNSQKRIKEVRIALLKSYPDFALIGDIADATKHAKLSLRAQEPRQLSSSDQLDVTSGFFNALFGEGAFAEAMVVYATLDDGSVKALLPAVRSVLSVWKSKF